METETWAYFTVLPLTPQASWSCSKEGGCYFKRASQPAAVQITVRGFLRIRSRHTGAEDAQEGAAGPVYWYCKLPKF